MASATTARDDGPPRGGDADGATGGGESPTPPAPTSEPSAADGGDADDDAGDDATNAAAAGSQDVDEVARDDGCRTGAVITERCRDELRRGPTDEGPGAGLWTPIGIGALAATTVGLASVAARRYFR